MTSNMGHPYRRFVVGTCHASCRILTLQIIHRAGRISLKERVGDSYRASTMTLPSAIPMHTVVGDPFYPYGIL
ncbi:hypothetical protein ZOSMA_204G00140 [Zostera marina]|uniref:Uncharacterized protein n=1 Tax=Zostera marina TaxID=29655 RepID=A0A0K9PLD9_ZOSMR|nr:hypothetical protein ZOSMA_204G00140 [Zostera marina]